MNKNLSLFLSVLCILWMIGQDINALEDELNLEDNVFLVMTGFIGQGFLDISPNIGPGVGPGIEYGLGGYGDPLAANFSLLVCPPDTVDRESCTAGDPDGGMYLWRFIENVGWRKFSPYGAARKDWWEFKAVIGYPFFRSF